MPAIIEPPEPGTPSPPLPRRLAWFFGLSVLSAGATACVAYLLKALLQ